MCYDLSVLTQEEQSGEQIEYACEEEYVAEVDSRAFRRQPDGKRDEGSELKSACSAYLVCFAVKI